MVKNHLNAKIINHAKSRVNKYIDKNNRNIYYYFSNNHFSIKNHNKGKGIVWVETSIIGFHTKGGFVQGNRWFPGILYNFNEIISGTP